MCLSRLAGAFRYTFKGKTATKDCICIPVEWLTEDKNGEVWANISLYESNKFEGQTHSLKQSFIKAQYDSLPTDENGNKMQLKFLGSIKLRKGRQNASETATAGSFYGSQQEDDGDLPF